MSYSFGDLLRQHIARRRDLTQKRLAELAGYDPSILTRMTQGKKELTGHSGRERVVQIIGVLRDEGVLSTRAEANALLKAGGMSPLYEGQPAEVALLRSLKSEPTHADDIRPTSLPHTNLPASLSSFIGRQREMVEVMRLLKTTRLLTLTGSGGAGKTRLAIEVGKTHAHSSSVIFPDGVWMVEFAALSEGRQVSDLVATALGLQSTSRTTEQILTEYLRSRSLLLILDNCEHLIHDCAALVGTLLRGCPSIRILSTSRERLNVPGEFAWRVPPLVQDEAVRLFEDRAQLAWPGFAENDQNKTAVAEIVHRLDGMPLALELAAARLRILSVEQIAALLDDRFALLTGGTRTALPRQQTLRATLDWSYDLLSEDERVLLQRLSVFAGGWTLEAAEAVCGERVLVIGDAGADVHRTISTSGVLNPLASLVDKSLVTVMAQPHSGQVRYHLLETIRQYAADRLGEAGQEQSLRDRHLAYCVAFAERADAEMVETKFIPWTNHFKADLDNLRASLGWCRANAAKPNYVGAGLRLTVALSWFWAMNNHNHEQLQWSLETITWNRAIAPSVAQTSTTLLAYALFSAWNPIASCSAWQHLSEMAVLAKEHLVQCQATSDRKGSAYCLLLLAHYAQYQHDISQARSLAAQSLALLDDVGDLRGISHAAFVLATILQVQRAYAEQVTLVEKYIIRLQELGDRWHYADLMRVLAWGLVLQEECERASAVCAQLLAHADEWDDPMLAWFAFDTLRIADHPRALVLALQYLERQRKVGDSQTLASALHNAGRILLDGGDLERARMLLDDCVDLWRTLDISWGTYSNLAHALCDRGIIARFQGDYPVALASFDESERLSTGENDVWVAAGVLFHRGTVLLGSGNIAAASVDFKESLNRYHARGNGLTPFHPLLLAALSEVARGRGRIERAMRLTGAAKAFGGDTRLNPPSTQFDYNHIVAAAHSRLDDPVLAMAWVDGQAMTLDQAVEYALQEGEADEPPTR